MGKPSSAPVRSPLLGRLTYPYDERPGFALSFRVAAYPDRYQITVQWNGTPCRRAARRSLAGALAWATREADHLLQKFGLPAKQVRLDDLLSEFRDQLAA